MGKVWERLSRDVDVKVDIEGAAPNHIFVHNIHAEAAPGDQRAEPRRGGAMGAVEAGRSPAKDAHGFHYGFHGSHSPPAEKGNAGRIRNLARPGERARRGAS